MALKTGTPFYLHGHVIPSAADMVEAIETEGVRDLVRRLNEWRGYSERYIRTPYHLDQGVIDKLIELRYSVEDEGHTFKISW